MIDSPTARVFLGHTTEPSTSSIRAIFCNAVFPVFVMLYSHVTVEPISTVGPVPATSASSPLVDFSTSMVEISTDSTKSLLLSVSPGDTVPAILLTIASATPLLSLSSPPSFSEILTTPTGCVSTAM